MTARTGVIYIQRDRFQVYSPMLPSVLEFKYIPEMIRDLDVLNKELLQSVIKLFIEQNKIPAGNLVFFLADNVAFVKDFTMQDEKPPEEKNTSEPKNPEAASVSKEKKEALDKQVKDYIDLTPFEEVASKKFVIKNGVRVFSANKELYMSIKEAFEKEHFSVDMVIPGLLLGNNISAQSVLTPEIAEFVIQHVGTLKQNNLLTPDVVHDPIVEQPEEEENNYEVKEEKAKPPDKKRLVLLAGVFALLLGILAVVYFTMGV